MSIADIEKAKKLFHESGLAFPTIPTELASQLKERGKWLFSTREIEISPYDLHYYIHEVDVTHVEDYVVLSHSGHGVNSYAIQYYIVYRNLQMFLHLGWGGLYMNVRETTTKIRKCFSLADKIIMVMCTVGTFQLENKLTIVASDFYKSYWFKPGKKLDAGGDRFQKPVELLTEVLHWLRSF
jgi:hypothetical protein